MTQLAKGLILLPAQHGVWRTSLGLWGSPLSLISALAGGGGGGADTTVCVRFGGHCRGHVGIPLPPLCVTPFLAHWAQTHRCPPDQILCLDLAHGGPIRD